MTPIATYRTERGRLALVFCDHQSGYPRVTLDNRTSRAIASSSRYALADYAATLRYFYHLDLVECGGCEQWHPAGFDGDCREDANRYDRPEHRSGRDLWRRLPANKRAPEGSRNG